ncbi:MAG TPA: sensor histidine kinase [Solirubrobacteraceae bacterium]|jgi:two-component system CitB family sensor kinase
MARFRRRRLSTRIFAFQALILVVTLLLGCLLALHAWRQRLDDEYERRALGVAQSVTADSQIAGAVAAGNRSGVVQARAEAVRRATGTSFVVVTDRRGIRFSHPDARQIGRHVSTDPGPALRGETVLAVQTGTLGRSARAKVPLRTRDGRIVGEVSVGILETKISEQLRSAIPVIALYGAIALGAGLLASTILAARLKRQTFGLELDEIADMLRQREATLRRIREGVVVVDTEGRVRVVNDEAARLLDLPDDAVGRPVDEVSHDERLGAVLAGRLRGNDLVLLHGERVLIANHVPVRLEGRDLGGVTTLRDRTELEGLLRELDSVRDLTDAMRAQAHEFSNRLHTLSGLLQLGHDEEALSFIREIAHADAALREVITRRIRDPHVAALLLAKSAVAGERGVELRLAEDSLLAGELRDPRALLTVLGNLVDNALDAARDSGREAPFAEVGLRMLDGGELLVRVADSGAGIPAGERERIFEPGYTTKPSGGIGSRGVGLSLVQRLVERRGGSIRVADAPRGGALFEVRLPVVLRPGSDDTLSTGAAREAHA